MKRMKKYNLCLGYVPNSSSARRPLGAAYYPILLSEVEQEQRPSGNGDREAIVLGAGLCDGEGERAYIAWLPVTWLNTIWLNFFVESLGSKIWVAVNRSNFSGRKDRDRTF